jgi:hypothetical protein
MLPSVPTCLSELLPLPMPILMAIQLQQLELDVTKRADLFIRAFTVADANFDGYQDFGIGADFGAKWASYMCYFFDAASGEFNLTPVSKERAALGAHEYAYNTDKQELITPTLGPCGPARSF